MKREKGTHLKEEEKKKQNSQKVIPKEEVVNREVPQLSTIVSHQYDEGG